MTPDEQGRRAIRRLRSYGVPIEPGLTEAERAWVEARFGFRFSREHGAFLAAGLPAGKAWPDWRDGAAADLRAWLDRPASGIVFDVGENEFWPAFWGPRPAAPADREAVARDELSRVPQLVPIRGHRYLPADPAPEPSPVFSVSQSDVIHYGGDLLNYFEVEFGQAERVLADAAAVPFWSDLATGAS